MKEAIQIGIAIIPLIVVSIISSIAVALILLIDFIWNMPTRILR